MDRVESVEAESATVKGTLDSRLGQTDAALAMARDEMSGTSLEASQKIEQLERRTQELVETRASKLEKGLEVVRLDLAASREREAALRSEITALRDAANTAKMRESDALERLDNVVEFHGNRIVQLEEQLRLAKESLAAPAAQPVGDLGAPAEWVARVPELRDPDPGIRLDAASILAESGDPAVVDHLLPLLDDDDLFVRMVVCQSLGKLGVKLACPGLIERLGDESITVREAAVIALRQITSQNFGFQHDGREADRKRQTDAWRKWWRREGDDFLAS